MTCLKTGQFLRSVYPADAKPTVQVRSERQGLLQAARIDPRGTVVAEGPISEAVGIHARRAANTTGSFRRLAAAL